MGCRWSSVRIRPPRPFCLTEVVALDFLTILLIALGLSADCFAIAIGGSATMKALTTGNVLRVSLAFGAAQALMPVIGWLAGRTVVDLISAYDHWAAFGLLTIIGGRMLWESLRHKPGEERSWDMTRGLPLLALSVATSIDALAVGLTFAFLEINVALASATIGMVAFTATAIGLVAGRRAARGLGRWSEAAGGLVLIGIGVRVVLSHLFG